MDPEATVGQLVVERPARSRVFEKFGIDYCCGGKQVLAPVCQAKGLDTAAVLSALETADNTINLDNTQDWSHASLTELADHIEATHHAYMTAELPRLDYLTQRVVNAHGGNHPELGQLRETFLAFKAELGDHMMKEESVLFPLCRQLESSIGPIQSHCGSIANPIADMVKEHDDAGAALTAMRTLTNDYTPPQGACNTYRAMLSGLAEMEADMHQHVHKENNILFPRSIEREKQMWTSAQTPKPSVSY